MANQFGRSSPNGNEIAKPNMGEVQDAVID
jgi:hypothetical protein